MGDWRERARERVGDLVTARFARILQEEAATKAAAIVLINEAMGNSADEEPIFVQEEEKYVYLLEGDIEYVFGTEHIYYGVYTDKVQCIEQMYAAAKQEWGDCVFMTCETQFDYLNDYLQASSLIAIHPEGNRLRKGCHFIYYSRRELNPAEIVGEHYE